MPKVRKEQGVNKACTLSLSPSQCQALNTYPSLVGPGLLSKGIPCFLVATVRNKPIGNHLGVAQGNT